MLICTTPEQTFPNPERASQSPKSQTADSVGRITPQLLLDNFRDAIKQKRLRTPPSKTGKIVSPTSVALGQFSSYYAASHHQGFILNSASQSDRNHKKHEDSGCIKFENTDHISSLVQRRDPQSRNQIPINSSGLKDNNNFVSVHQRKTLIKINEIQKNKLSLKTSKLNRVEQSSKFLQTQ